MRSNRKGFSLLAVVGTLASMSIALGALAPVFVQRIEQEHVKKAVREMRIIQDSAKEYYNANGSFPASIQSLKDAGYLSSAWDTSDPWGGVYQVASAADTFSITASRIPQRYHGLVSASMPFVYASGNQITSSVPVPGYEAGMDPIVHLSGDDSRRTLSGTLRTRSVNTQTYYLNLETGQMRISDWYVEDLSSQPDGSKRGMWLGEYEENIRISVER